MGSQPPSAFSIFHLQWSDFINVTSPSLMHWDWSSAFLRHSGCYTDQISVISISSYHWSSHWLQHFAIKSIYCHCDSLQDWFLNATGNCASTRNTGDSIYFSTILLNIVFPRWCVCYSNNSYFRIQFSSLQNFHLNSIKSETLLVKLI